MSKLGFLNPVLKQVSVDISIENLREQCWINQVTNSYFDDVSVFSFNCRDFNEFESLN